MSCLPNVKHRALRMVVWLLLLSQSPLHACLYPVSFQERTARAETIVLARLIDQYAYWDAEHQNIYTSNILEVTAYLKGYRATPTVCLVSMGGFVGNEGQITHPSVQMEFNVEYLIFLETQTLTTDNKALRTAHPDWIQAQAFASVQGVLPLHDGKYHDLLAQPPTSEAEILNQIRSLTGLIARKPDGTPFEARTHPAPAYARNPITSLENGAGTVTSTFRAGLHDPDEEMVIKGSGFGYDQGTVEYRNADNGGSSFTTPPINSDYVSWSDTEIRVKVPQRAGTGTMRVKDEDGAIVGTTSITVEWSMIPVNSNFYLFSEETRQNVRFISRSPDCGGIVFQYNRNSNGGFSNNPDAKAAFQRAIASWRCATGVNFSIHPYSTTIGFANDDISIVMYDNSLPNGVLGRCTSRFSANGNSSCNLHNTVWYVKELDLQFPTTPSSGFTWCYSGTPSGSQYDFESVALHEVGHGHGLAHLIDNAKTMNYAISNGSMRRILSSEEIAAGDWRLALPTTCFSNFGFSAMTEVQPADCNNVICAALPVELLTFTASASESNQVRLQWSTSSETNNERFELQRSAEARYWTTLASIPGHGNSSTVQTYEYVDQAPLPDNNYYRLRQVDFDQTESISPIRLVRLDKETMPPTLFPNPASKTESVRIQAPGYDVTVFDVGGRVLQTISSSEPDDRLIQTGELAEGFYWISFSNGEKTVVKKLVVY